MKKHSLKLFIAASFSFCLSYNFSTASLGENIIYPVFSVAIPGSLRNPTSVPDKNDLTGLMFSDAIPSFSYSDKKSNITHETANPYTSPIYINEDIPLNVKETEIVKGGTSLYGIEINNETDYDLSDALQDVTIPENPTVLIVHTHTSESYRPSSLYPYTPTDNSRTEDTDFNVARVGAELASELNSYGINVIHDSELNDYPSYNGSYKKTLELIEKHLHNNPKIDIIIDLHRDAMERSDGIKLSPVCNINGEKSAQVMLVVGTDQGGLTHPGWKNNFSFAVKLQTIINKNFPHLARPVNVRKERFNGHVSEKELIIEVGTTGNTLEEALVSARALAFSINEFYNG